MYTKVNGVRSADNNIGNSNLLVHRFYGAISIDGKIYRTKTTIYEIKDSINRTYNYKITEIELIVSGSQTSNARTNPISIFIAKLLKLENRF
jgi:hypothetical protein